MIGLNGRVEAVTEREQKQSGSNVSGDSPNLSRPLSSDETIAENLMFLCFTSPISPQLFMSNLIQIMWSIVDYTRFLKSSESVTTEWFPWKMSVMNENRVDTF